MTVKRNYGIDLLRLVFMYMICLLHTLSHGGIISACLVGGAEYKVYSLVKVFTLCAVDGFAIISGYMANDKPRKYSKIVDMWFQAIFYSFILTVILMLAGFGEGITLKVLFKNAFPIIFKKYWYFYSYVLLFFAAPMLNKYLFSVDENTAKKVIILLVVLFSVAGILKDTFEVQKGYSALWLIVLYCIGVLAKRIKIFEEKKTPVLIALFLLCNLISWGAYIFAGVDLIISYVSPTVLLSGLILVVLFSRLQFKGGVISKLSPLAFGVYLFQINKIVWEVFLKKTFAFVAQYNIAAGVLCAFGIAFCIFAAGLAIEFIRSKIAKLIRLHSLSEAIVRLADKAMMKVSVLMK